MATISWMSLWERLAHHFGGGWPEHVPTPHPRSAETPESLHRQLDRLEDRIAARRMKVLESESMKHERPI